MRIRLALLLLVAAGALAGPPPAGAARVAPRGKLTVGVEVLRFNPQGPSATGLVTARLTDEAGHTRSARTRVSLKATAAGGSCRVVHLFLGEVTLQLLGLTAHLDKATLDVTGEARDGALGSIFCRLARAKATSMPASLAGALTSGVRRGTARAFQFTAVLRPATRLGQARCAVLDLVAGPRKVQMLGLRVELQARHLEVAAAPGGGALGERFCRRSA